MEWLSRLTGYLPPEILAGLQHFQVADPVGARIVLEMSSRLFINYRFT